MKSLRALTALVLAGLCLPACYQDTKAWKGGTKACEIRMRNGSYFSGLVRGLNAIRLKTKSAEHGLIVIRTSASLLARVRYSPTIVKVSRQANRPVQPRLWVNNTGKTDVHVTGVTVTNKAIDVDGNLIIDESNVITKIPGSVTVTTEATEQTLILTP